LTDLEREFGKLKEEKRELGGLKAAMAEPRRRHEQEICDRKHEMELLRQASDGQRESPAADVRKVFGQLAGQLEDLRSGNGYDRSRVGDIAGVNEQLRVEAARLNGRTEMLKQDNRRIAEPSEVVKRNFGEMSNCRKVK
jgi:hypothetical protein